MISLIVAHDVVLNVMQGEDGGRWESIEALVDADTPEAREKLKQQLLGMKDWWSDGKKGDGQDPDSAKETKPSKKEKGERGNLVSVRAVDSHKCDFQESV